MKLSLFDLSIQKTSPLRPHAKQCRGSNPVSIFLSLSVKLEKARLGDDAFLSLETFSFPLKGESDESVQRRL